MQINSWVASGALWTKSQIKGVHMLRHHRHNLNLSLRIRYHARDAVPYYSKTGRLVRTAAGL